MKSKQIWKNIFMVGCVVIVFAAIPLGCYVNYFSDYWMIGHRLRSLPGVTVITSWQHRDTTLEDFGYTLRVRNCAPVSVNFYEGREWRGLFGNIDGIVLMDCDNGGYKAVSVAVLQAKGVVVRNLPEVVENLEAVLKVASALPSTTDDDLTDWPPPDRDYVMLGYPIENCMAISP